MELGTVAAPALADTTPEPAADVRNVCTSPIDLVHLARYTLGNKALEREILDLFVGQSLLILDRLTAAATDKEWRDDAHALLGSARAVGAKRVADRVLVAQKLPGACNDPARATALASIGRELDIANRYIRDLFPDE